MTRLDGSIELDLGAGLKPEHTPPAAPGAAGEVAARDVRPSIVDQPVLLEGVTTAFTDTLVYACPTGFDVHLHRCAVSAPGVNGGAPLTGAAGVWLTFTVGPSEGQRVVWAFPSASGGVVVPVVQADGRGSAKVLRSGQQLYVSGQLTGLTADAAVIWLQLAMYPLQPARKAPLGAGPARGAAQAQ